MCGAGVQARAQRGSVCTSRINARVKWRPCVSADAGSFKMRGTKEWSVEEMVRPKHTSELALNN